MNASNITNIIFDKSINEGKNANKVNYNDYIVDFMVLGIISLILLLLLFTCLLISCYDPIKRKGVVLCVKDCFGENTKIILNTDNDSFYDID